MRRVIFAALIGLIVLTAIPYGTIEAWWKAAFICAVFGICIVAIIEWTLSGSIDYDAPAFGGRLNLNSTLSYRSSSQQFELRSPGIDQPGFALWDANIMWRSNGGRYEFGLHGKNLANKKYVVSGYNFLLQNPYTGDFITAAGTPITSPTQAVPTLGRTGVLTGFYGNPRQIWLSAAVNF